MLVNENCIVSVYKCVLALNNIFCIIYLVNDVVCLHSGYSGRQYDQATFDRYGNTVEPSGIGKLQHQYWLTKQTVIKKIGKQEDEFVVAGDSELDAKLAVSYSFLIYITYWYMKMCV